MKFLALCCTNYVIFLVTDAICKQLLHDMELLLIQVRQEISPVVMTVISSLVPILQHAQVMVPFFCTNIEHVSSFLYSGTHKLLVH